MAGMRGGRAAAVLAGWVIAAGVAAPAAGQSPPDVRTWTGVAMQGRVGPGSPWRWNSDSLVRARNGAGTLDFVAERVVLTRDVAGRSSVGIGYAYGRGFPDGGSLREHRFVQQYLWNRGGAGRWLSLKTRVEERYVTGQDSMALRVRQQVRITWSLPSRQGLRAVAAEELFVRANSTKLGSRGFDSNRVFLGVARPLTSRSSLEVGYVNIVWRSASGDARRSHVMSATLAVGL
ncbi:MAG: DUF2490 domain-containing protein [Vicinamibacterales bacterium]